MPSREVKVAIIGDARGFSQAVNEADGRLGKLGGSFAKFAKVAAVGLAGGAAGAVAFGKSLYDAAIESQKVTKQTEAVLKSMGDASNVTAKQVADLSTKLSMQTGVDDELIQSGENILLTFGKVRNEVGKGNDIFTRGTKAALDMSVALGTDMKGASIQVGKALNDPVKGLTALGRAGVSFTQQQKDQVKAMVAAGDTLGAQKLILSELEKQFKGSAAAQATSGEKLKVVWGNLQEELGARLVPVVEKAAGFLADKLPKALDGLGRAFGPIAKQVGMFWYSLTSGFTEDEGTPIERLALRIREIVPKVIDGFKKVIEWVQTNWPKIREVIGQVMTTVGSIIRGVVDVVTTLWNNFGNNILELVQRIWPRIQQVIEGAMTIIRNIIQVITALIHGDWSGVWEGIKGIVSGAWEAIQGIIGGALELVRSIIGIGLEIVGSIFKGAWDAIVGGVTGFLGSLLGHWRGILQILTGPLGLAITWVVDHIGGIYDAVKTVVDKVISVGKGVWDWVVGGLSGLVNSALGIIEGLVNGIISAINAAIRAYNKLPLAPNIGTIDHVKLGKVSSGPKSVGEGAKKKLHEFGTGGVIPGPRGMPTPILAHAGETVLPTHKPGWGMAGGPVNITIHTGADPNAVVDAIDRWASRNGGSPMRRSA